MSGPKPKLTKAHCDAVRAKVARLGWPKYAFEELKIPPETARQWVRKGHREGADPLLALFAREVAAGRSQYQAEMVRTVREAGDDGAQHWGALKWLLSKHDPETFGDSVTLKHEGIPEGEQDRIRSVMLALSADEQSEVAAALELLSRLGIVPQDGEPSGESNDA